jgi:hypothetical protein
MTTYTPFELPNERIHMSSFIDLSGQTFGYLTALERDLNATGGKTVFVCHCRCGRTLSVQSSSLRSGNTNSCGCYQKEKTAEANTTHGQEGTSLYSVWSGIKQRTGNPLNSNYERYGARGVRVHPEWSDSFESFQQHILENLGDRPSTEHSLDRINNEGNYEPGNIKWSTEHDQSRNRRSNINVEYQGKIYVLIDLARELGLDYDALRYQLNRKGRSVEQSIEILSQKTSS